MTSRCDIKKVVTILIILKAFNFLRYLKKINDLLFIQFIGHQYPICGIFRCEPREPPIKGI